MSELIGVSEQPELAERLLAAVSRSVTLTARTAAWAARTAAAAPLLPVRAVTTRTGLPGPAMAGLGPVGAQLRELGQALATAAGRAVILRLDLTDLVCELVDLDRIVARVDLARVIARIDVDAVVARANLDLIIDRLDLIGLARYVVDGIDLPDLIRESTGSVTSEMVRDVRTQSAAADHQIERAIDRVLLRRHERRVAEPDRSGDELDGPG